MENIIKSYKGQGIWDSKDRQRPELTQKNTPHLHYR